MRTLEEVKKEIEKLEKEKSEIEKTKRETLEKERENRKREVVDAYSEYKRLKEKYVKDYSTDMDITYFGLKDLFDYIYNE